MLAACSINLWHKTKVMHIRTMEEVLRKTILYNNRQPLSLSVNTAMLWSGPVEFLNVQLLNNIIALLYSIITVFKAWL